MALADRLAGLLKDKRAEEAASRDAEQPARPLPAAPRRAALDRADARVRGAAALRTRRRRRRARGRVRRASRADAASTARGVEEVFRAAGAEPSSNLSPRSRRSSRAPRRARRDVPDDRLRDVCTPRPRPRPSTSRSRAYDALIALAPRSTSATRAACSSRTAKTRSSGSAPEDRRPPPRRASARSVLLVAGDLRVPGTACLTGLGTNRRSTSSRAFSDRERTIGRRGECDLVRSSRGRQRGVAAPAPSPGSVHAEIASTGLLATYGVRARRSRRSRRSVPPRR